MQLHTVMSKLRPQLKAVFLVSFRGSIEYWMCRNILFNTDTLEFSYDCHVYMLESVCKMGFTLAFSLIDLRIFRNSKRSESSQKWQLN